MNVLSASEQSFVDEANIECTASKDAGNEFVLGEQSPMTDIIHPTLLGG